MYSHACRPAPSTTAWAPLLRTAKRSPARPCTKSLPPVAPYKAPLPMIVFSRASNVAAAGGTTMILPPPNDMRVFQEEIFGPTLGITTFKDEAEALATANATEYGLGAGVWTRDTNRAFRMARGIKAGRVWLNCYGTYPAHAAFGGYKKSGIGRPTGFASTTSPPAAPPCGGDLPCARRSR